MDPKRSALHRSVDRIGRVCEQHMKVFHIETVLNSRMFSGPLDFLMKNEDEFTEADTLKFHALKWTLKRTRALRREVFMRTPSPYELIAVHAGKAEEVHERSSPRATSSTACPSRAGRYPDHRHPLHLAVQREQQGAKSPARAGHGAGLLLSHMYRNKPLLKKAAC